MSPEKAHVLGAGATPSRPPKVASASRKLRCQVDRETGANELADIEGQLRAREQFVARGHSLAEVSDGGCCSRLPPARASITGTSALTVTGTGEPAKTAASASSCTAVDGAMGPMEPAGLIGDRRSQTGL